MEPLVLLDDVEEVLTFLLDIHLEIQSMLLLGTDWLGVVLEVIAEIQKLHVREESLKISY